MSQQERVATWIHSSLALQRLNTQAFAPERVWPEEVSDKWKAPGIGGEIWEFTVVSNGEKLKVRVEVAL